MTMKIITGYTATKHITPADDAGLHRSMFGSDCYVLASGSQLAATAESATEIRIDDGELVMQGRHARNSTGYEVVQISNGVQGLYRNDLIVARYSVDASTSVETISLVAITGTAVSGSATDPSYTVGDIENGETKDFPLYRVRLNGVNIEGVDQLFKVAKSSEGLEEYIDSVAKDIEENIEDVELELKASINTKANSSHSHAMSDLTGALPVTKGGTGATTASAARTNLGALGNSGLQEMTNGTIRIVDTSDSGQGFAVRRPYENGQRAFSALVGSDGGAYIRNSNIDADDNTTVLNYLWLGESKSTLKKPLTVSSGGTGASTAAEARANLGIDDELGELSRTFTTQIQALSQRITTLETKVYALESKVK